MTRNVSDQTGHFLITLDRSQKEILYTLLKRF